MYDFILKLWIRLKSSTINLVKDLSNYGRNGGRTNKMKNLESIFNVSLQSVFACITSLTFFYSVSEPVLNYPLFVIEGKVFSVVLIHILFVEVALLFSSFKILMLENISKIQSQVQHKLYKLSVSSYVIHLASEK